MATSLKLRSDIKKYEAAIKSKATPAKFKDKLKVQLGKAKSQLESMKSSKAKKPSAPKKKSALDKLKARYKGSGVYIKKILKDQLYLLVGVLQKVAIHITKIV
jgi:hypothetical protein